MSKSAEGGEGNGDGMNGGVGASRRVRRCAEGSPVAATHSASRIELGRGSALLWLASMARGDGIDITRAARERAEIWHGHHRSSGWWHAALCSALQRYAIRRGGRRLGSVRVVRCVLEGGARIGAA